MTVESLDSPDSEAERLFVEWLARQPSASSLRGTNAEAADTFATLCDDHPEHAAALQRLYADYRRLVALLERFGLTLPVAPIGDAGAGPSLAEQIRTTYGPDVDPGIALEPQGAAATPSDFSVEVLSRLSTRPDGSGRFRILGEVARGGQGAILRVWDEDLRRNLAMKVTLGRASPPENAPAAAMAGSTPAAPTPPVDGRTVGRFLEEAQVTSQLDHPGIVPVHELGLDRQGRVFFTMKLVKGEDLKRVFARVHAGETGWTITRVLSLLLKVCEAMSYAHAKRVIHRDLKPSNIMVGRYGEVFVMDWGLARVLDRKDDKDVRVRPHPASLTSEVHSERRERAASEPDSPLFTMDGDVVGTPAYMSPEQASGHIERMGPPSDVYALGAMLYHLLTGRMPYVSPGAYVNNYAILSRVQEGPPASVGSMAPQAPAELVAICEKAMAREPGARYGDMSALADDLRAFLERRVVSAYERGALAEGRKWVRRNRLLAASIAGGLLLVFASLITILTIQGRRNAEIQEANREISAAEQQAVAAAEAARGAEGRAEARSVDAERALNRVRIKAAEASIHLERFGEAERLLDQVPVGERRLEWRLLHGLADTSVAFIPAPAGCEIVAVSQDGLAAIVRTTGGKGGEFLRGSLRDGLSTLSPIGALDGLDSVVFTPDLQMAAAVVSRGIGGSQWRVARLDGTAVQVDFAHPRALFKSILSADGTRFCFHREDGIAVYEMPGGTEVFFHPDPVEYRKGWSYSASAEAMSRDGRLLLIRSGSTDVVDLKSGTIVATLKQGADSSYYSFSDDDSLIVGWGSDSGHASLWDVHTGRKITSVSLPSSPVSFATFTPDSRELIVCGSDGAAAAIDTASGARVCSFSGGTAGTIQLTVTEDGLLLASGRDGVRIWRLHELTGGNNGTFEFSATAMAFLDGGTELVLHGPVLKALCDLDSGVFLDSVYATQRHGEGSLSVGAGAICGAGTRCLLALSDQKKDSYPLYAQDLFQPNRSLLAENIRSWDAAEYGALSYDGRLWLTLKSRVPTQWLAPGESIHHAPSERGGLSALIAEWLVKSMTESLPANSSAVIVDLQGREPMRSSTIRCEVSWAALFSLDDRKVIILQPPPDMDPSSIQSRASPPGMFTGCCLWDLETGEERCLMEPTPVDETPLDASIRKTGGFRSRWQEPAPAAAFSADATRVAVSLPDRIAIWDTDSGVEPLLVIETAAGCGPLAFSPDGTRLASAGEDRVIRLWDAATGEELIKLAGPTRTIKAVAFNPDGACLATAGDDGVRVWRTQQRKQALDEIRSAMDRIRRVRNYVQALLDDDILIDSVTASIRVNPDLSAEDRDLALQLAFFNGDSTVRTERSAWNCLSRAGLSTATYTKALVAAQVSFMSDPVAEAEIAIGAGLFRLNRLDEAESSLCDAEELVRRERDRDPRGTQSWARQRSQEIAALRALLELKRGDWEEVEFQVRSMGEGSVDGGFSLLRSEVLDATKIHAR